MYCFKKIIFLILLCCFVTATKAQLIIRDETSAAALVQKLLGQGVVVSNISFTGNSLMAGHFNNNSGTKIGIDSGIVLTTGRAKTDPLVPGRLGVDGDGVTPAQNKTANNIWGLPGDNDLAAEIAVAPSELNDACVLEFDFIPLGDSIRFNYVFSSEEYVPAYVCDFNDAFAFFISGPGFPSQTNIALVPGSPTPVSIKNVNDVPGGTCPKNQVYYWNNQLNNFFTHDGHTKIFTAEAKVQPCQTYHLKLVIADMGDDWLDSGVFLEAKSLSSNAIKIQNLAQLDPTGNSYLVEGCVTGSIKIKRPKVEATPLAINLSYGGTVQNGIDIQPLPLSVVIPANQTEVEIPLLPNIDGIPEGIETLKIYALAGCASGLPTDSAVIQLRDYDILGINPDTMMICKEASIQLLATPGYATYTWDANSTLSSTVINNPMATPVSSETTYYCTASIGTCNARDSAFIKWKELALVSKKDVNCKGASTGEITVTGSGWTGLVAFSLNGGPPQSSSTFSNLPVGRYVIKINETSSACEDSVIVNIVQAFPDLELSTLMVSATCSGLPDGTVTITPTGGNGSYTFSSDGINFQSSNVFTLGVGNYNMIVKDGNGCINSTTETVVLGNSVTLEAGADETICEGESKGLDVTSNAAFYAWTPSVGLSSTVIANPVASPTTTTKYYITATTGICTRIDSLTVNVNPAPIANAGANTSICYGADIRLNGSGGTKYLWSPASYLSDHRIAAPLARKLPGTITYSLQVIDNKGCVSLQKSKVTITVTRPALVKASNDTSIAMNQPLQLSAIDVHNAGFIDYQWSPPTGLNDATSQYPVAVINRDTRYIVTARTAIGCESSDTVYVKAYKGPDIYVPNAFSPNNDGLNDILHPVPIGMREFHFFRLFNRFGEMIFSTTDPRRGWDGKIKGTPQNPATTFVWIAEGIDYTGKLVVRKGMVTIVK